MEVRPAPDFRFAFLAWGSQAAGSAWPFRCVARSLHPCSSPCTLRTSTSTSTSAPWMAAGGGQAGRGWPRGRREWVCGGERQRADGLGSRNFWRVARLQAIYRRLVFHSRRRRLAGPPGVIGTIHTDDGKGFEQGAWMANYFQMGVPPTTHAVLCRPARTVRSDHSPRVGGEGRTPATRPLHNICEG